jgi:asparagine synthase (glutamine-hydrolysing)
MSLNLVDVAIDSESLWKVLTSVIRLLKSRKRMDVEISIPFFFAAQEARERGYQLLVSGQGPDELFGGYARYEKMMISEGTEKVEQALWEDVSVTDESNIQRDTAIVKFHGLEAFFPYLYPQFMSTALMVPATLNIDPNKTPARKLMFRELAMRLGVPEEVAKTPKRATQFSSGTSKMLTKSLQKHVEAFGSLSKKELQPAIQEFLDGI